MIVVLVFTTVAYIGFTKGPLASYADIAEANDRANLDLQVLYGKENDAVLYSENLLAKGLLSIKNPNKHVVTANIKFKISRSVDLSTLDIIINGRPLDVEKKEVVGDYYLIPVSQYEMEAYETITFDTGIYGNPYNTDAFEYNFDITESFYN